jgi:mono/diheme cytochrome c family protein
MSTVWGLAAYGLAAAGALAAAIAGDARRGEELFRSQQCIQCHSINGKGGTLAPDLGRRIDRNYTPAVMASLMWNHAPRMWAAMKKENIAKAELSPEAAADLFAYFVSVRFFEQPGDAGRGKQLFASKRCADCHGIEKSPNPAAPPVAKWGSLADPIVLAQQMWNHGSGMKEELAKRKIPRPTLTAQELTDMLVYLQHLPETRNETLNFTFPSSDKGEELFRAKGCAGCHTGALAFETVLKNQTLTQIAAAMWDHQPLMKTPSPTLSEDEMREIVSYIWARQYFEGNGSAERGKRVFSEKHCATCHDDSSSGAPKLPTTKGGYSDITMVSTLWMHGPQMLDMMNARKLEWPRFTAPEMSDLIAYLNSR